MTNSEEREQRMLELSMYHVSQKTYEWIKNSGVKWYEEDETGVMIPINEEQLNTEMPDDLKILMQTADDCNCGYLILDPLATEVSCLPTYHVAWA